MEQCFLERFEKYKMSQKVALVCGGVSLTYAQLYQRALTLAAKLRKNGTGLISTAPESYDIFRPKAAEHSPWVAVISGRSINAVVGAVAAWMAGGAYVLTGSDAPQAYIDGILEDTAATILRDGDFGDLSAGGGEFTYLYPKESEIACAVFTSGSTGRSKGAVLEHRSINEMLKWQTEYMESAGWTATASYSPFSFIASLWELFFPLANGLTLHILDENTRCDLFALERYIETHNISYMFLPPNIAEVFTQTYKGESLKYLRVAGGRLKSCGDPGGRYEIMYHLGMAENGGSVTFKAIREAMSGDIPIGKPWNQTHIDFIEGTGEMVVSGPSLFRGYLARREETRKSLTDGRFKSGDIVQLHENGELFHMGRNDLSVKIRDMKVNPMQVESALVECPGVDECCVTAQPLGGEDVLIGWITGNAAEEALRAQLAARLPEHMVPEVIVALGEMPRNINGKIDRNALIYTREWKHFRHPGLDPGSHEGIAGQARNDVGKSEGETGIAELFARVLGCLVGDDDNFLVLGGNSLKFMRLQAELAREFAVNIPYTVLFANPTPRMLAEILSRQTGYMPIPPAPPMEEYPLSEPMRQMWLLWRTGQDGGKYTVTVKCRFTGEIDKSRVMICFEELVRRNSILRSRFSERGGDVYQVIEENAEVVIGRQPRREFDLSTTPLFDISLNENMMTISAHHIIADAMGMRALAEDFWTLYGGETTQESAQVIDITMWSLNGKNETDEEYWKELFSGGVPRLDLPYDFERPARLQSSKEESVFFSADETGKLTEYAAVHGATLFQLFLAAYAMLLSRLSGENPVVIGVPFAGRDHPDMARSIGMFIKTLPVKLDAGGTNLSGVLTHTREMFLAVSERQDMSLERLAKLADYRRSPGRNLFYDVMINYIPLPRSLPDACGLKPEIIRGGYPGALFDLVLDVREENEGMSAVLNYADSLLLPETARSWARMLKDLLILPESILMDVWKEVLGTDEDDFFAAGGTSLDAIRIEADLFEKGWLLSAADIFMNPKLSDIAKLMTPADNIEWEDNE